jgi:hypothetical protein
MLKGQARGANPPEEFERLVAPHVKSFDFFLGEGMDTAVALLEPLRVRCVLWRGACRVQPHRERVVLRM